MWFDVKTVPLGRGDCFIGVESASYCNPHQARTNPRHQGEREVVRREDYLQNGRVRLPDLWRHQSTNRRVYWKAYWERGTAKKHTKLSLNRSSVGCGHVFVFLYRCFINLWLCVKILCRAFYKYITTYFMSSYFVHIPDYDDTYRRPIIINIYRNSTIYNCTLTTLTLLFLCDIFTFNYYQIIDDLTQTNLTMTIRGKNIRTWTYLGLDNIL